MTALLQISRKMWQWKNFENRTVFDEVMCRLRWLTFLAHPAYLQSAPKVFTPKQRPKRALILFIQTLAIYKSFTYLITYLN